MSQNHAQITQPPSRILPAHTSRSTTPYISPRSRLFPPRQRNHALSHIPLTRVFCRESLTHTGFLSDLTSSQRPFSLLPHFSYIMPLSPSPTQPCKPQWSNILPTPFLLSPFSYLTPLFFSFFLQLMHSPRAIFL